MTEAEPVHIATGWTDEMLDILCGAEVPRDGSVPVRASDVEVCPDCEARE